MSWTEGHNTRSSVNKGGFRQIVQYLGKITTFKTNVRRIEIVAYGAQSRLIDDIRISVTSIRGIELPRRIHPIQTVIAGTVQVQQAGSLFHGRQGGKSLRIAIQITQGIEIFRGIFVSAQVSNKSVHIIPNHLIYGHKFPVKIVHNGFLRMQRKQYRSSAGERLAVYRYP